VDGATKASLPSVSRVWPSTPDSVPLDGGVVTFQVRVSLLEASETLRTSVRSRLVSSAIVTLVNEPPAKRGSVSAVVKLNAVALEIPPNLLPLRSSMAFLSISTW
jgi:hypothetical protein